MKKFLIHLIESDDISDFTYLNNIQNLKDLERNQVDSILLKLFGYSYDSLMDEYEKFKPVFTIEDKHDAFSLSIAFSFWLQHWWSGQSCDKYAAYCYLVNNFKLDVKESFDDLDVEVLDYYNQLTEDNWEKAFDELCLYLDNEWDKDD